MSRKKWKIFFLSSLLLCTHKSRNLLYRSK